MYTGVKKMHIDPEEKGVKLSSDAESAVRDALSVKPNNALYSPYVRWPFPFGLWVYNHVEPKKDRGFKHWFYERFAKTPVLISTVQPDLRVAVVRYSCKLWIFFFVGGLFARLQSEKS